MSWLNRLLNSKIQNKSVYFLEKYGRSINFYSWSERKLIQTIDLGKDGIAPLEIRFLHNPKASEGFVGCAVNSTVFRYVFILQIEFS